MMSPVIRQFRQISESHCGPAVLQMLLDAIGIASDQRQIAAAGGAADTIDDQGMLIEQLALACSRVAPQTQFWYKYQADIEDVRYVLSRGFGVGVEWQGLFYDSEEEEEPGGDYGHYSIVSYIDEDSGEVIIVDPYKDFVGQHRSLPTDTFVKRWWDENEVRDNYTGRRITIKDEQVLFFVTPGGETMPEERNFKKFQLNS